MPGIARRGVLSTLMVASLLVFAGRPSAALLAQTANQTPTEVYLAYRSALAKATGFTELLPFIDAKSRGDVEAMPAEMQTKMFTLMMQFQKSFTDIKVTAEKVVGTGATLTATGNDPKGQAATGTIALTKEASGWKVDTREKWSSKPSGL